MTQLAPAPSRIAAGSPALRRLQVAMVCAGLTAFALLYDTQALLPAIGTAFGLDAATASLTVSVTTGTLAVTVLPMSALAERLGRTRVMGAGLAVACAAVALGAAAPDVWLLLVTRAVVGLALAAVVAVAMGHIGAEVEPSAAGAAIGVYVSGTSLGGLLGRLVTAGVADVLGWRWAIVVLAAAGALGTALFVRQVPAGRPAPAARTGTARAVAAHLRDPGVVRLCVVALLLMGGFVAMYNYLTYRLAAAPYRLPESVVGLVFLAYLSGTASSTAAGRLARRVGRPRVLLGSIAVSLAGLALTLDGAPAAILAGLVLFTAGFFGAHATASGWVTVRARADPSHASALYLLAYYLGSSLGGWAVGLAWAAGGWPLTAGCVGALFLLAGLVAAGVRDQDRTAAVTA